MKKVNIYSLLVLIAALALISVGYFAAPETSAQTADRARTAATASPSPTATAVPSPTVDPDDPNEIIKVDTELVSLNVRVIDRNSRSLNSLKKEEFKVYENNVIQEIDSFSIGEVPTNYALVIDNSGSLRPQLEKVIEASKIIVGTNRPDDETTVIRFVSSEKVEIVQDFTAKKSEIGEALDNLYIEGGQTAIIDAVYLAAMKVDEYERSKNPNDKKRRALILVSDGEDRSSYYKEQQLFELLRESDVQIYAVGFVNELTKEGGFVSKSPQEKAKAFMTRLATETGGKVYFPNSVSELEQIAKDISNELRTQYVISYYPTDTAGDGSFKNIKVVVADGPNKEKRIAVTRSGRKTGNPTGAPVLQKQNQ